MSQDVRVTVQNREDDALRGVNAQAKCILHGA
ncbi:MAG: hypothetical protein ACI8R9_000734 [Paraglaciecola sp.]|jgi:hypothetical protein